MTARWSRRAWLTTHAVWSTALVTRAPLSHRGALGSGFLLGAAARATRVRRAAAQAARLEPGPAQALALRAVDAARTAGARYADARLTRDVFAEHHVKQGNFVSDVESQGVGIRVLVNGYWGFAACPFWEPDEVVRLARDAVAQAKANAKGPARPMDLGHVPVVTGTWTTPIRIDPFTVALEEKTAYMQYWQECAHRVAKGKDGFGYPAYAGLLRFARQERVLATSEGSLVTQTVYESGGNIVLGRDIWEDGKPERRAEVNVQGIDHAGAGWERLLDAHIPEQMPSLYDEAYRKALVPVVPATVGRYTLVCDGATMAALLDQTLGVATQLDRALGYEANAGGTSVLDDPLAMLGHVQVAVSSVTITANRTAPTQLATVQWDDEGVAPEPFTLVKEGVLTDFQTTREQAAWLAPYYQRQGQPVRSHGCAAAENAFFETLQQMPNLALEPSPSAIRLEDLVADVPDGILIEGGQVTSRDVQARSGLLEGGMREIRHGKLGSKLDQASVLFNSQDLWQQVVAMGGQESTDGTIVSQNDGFDKGFVKNWLSGKGQPRQVTSHSVRAVAATIANQPVIDPRRRA